MPVDSLEDQAIYQSRWRMPSWVGGQLEFRHTGRRPRWQRPAYAGPPCDAVSYTVVVPMDCADPSYRRKSVSQQDDQSDNDSNRK
jgi:hypothetical protein